MSAYHYDDMVEDLEWSLLGLDALERCTEYAAYSASQRDDEPEMSLLHMRAARRAGALASLWWLTGWEDVPELEVE